MERKFRILITEMRMTEIARDGNCARRKLRVRIVGSSFTHTAFSLGKYSILPITRTSKGPMKWFELTNVRVIRGKL